MPETRSAAVLAATIGASSMAFIDGSIVQIALPVLQVDLAASFSALQWVVTVYTLFLGALVLVGGAYGDSLGRRKVFVAGIVLFTLASAGCGLAPGIGVLIAARAVQGVGAALMVPQSLAIIAAEFPEETRGRAIGTWAAASALTTALGPSLGGFLVDALSWRAAFLVNLPIGAAALALTLSRVPESRAARPSPPDWPGGLLAAVGFGALTVGLVDLPTRGAGDGLVLAAFAVAVLGLAGFLWREAAAAEPMMPLGLFRDRVFAGVNALTVLLYGALSGVLFLVPYTLVGLHGYSAAEAGLAMLPMGLSIGLLSRAAGGLGDRIGNRIPMIAGSALVAVAMAALAVTEAGGSYWTGVFGPLAGIGIGMAVVISPLTTTVMNAVGADRLLDAPVADPALRTAADVAYAGAFRVAVLANAALAAAAAVTAALLPIPRPRQGG